MIKVGQSRFPISTIILAFMSLTFVAAVWNLRKVDLSNFTNQNENEGDGYDMEQNDEPSSGNDIGEFNNAKFQWLNEEAISPTDPKVVQVVKENYMFPPSPRNVPYNLKNDAIVDRDPSMGQSQLVRKIFEGHKDEKNGFFVECGAWDGETRSNTVYLERNQNWSGLLIEASPVNFEEVQTKNRKSWISNACLSIKSHPTLMGFEQSDDIGRFSTVKSKKKSNVMPTAIQCFAFETFMTALNRTRIDFFSLDVEGAELKILKTIPFDKYDIRVLAVEYIHDPEGKQTMRKFMQSKGYFSLVDITHPLWWANDFMFVKSSFFKKLSPERITHILEYLSSIAE